MKNKIINIAIILLIPLLLLAVVDQKDALLKQANRLIAYRQYEKANQIYEQILNENPNDHSVAELYITNLIRISKIELASEKLDFYSNIMPEMTFVRLHAAILLNQGELSKARDEAFDYLSKNQRGIYFFRSMAMVFEQYRQYEIAIEILEMAREIAKDENLYSRELAINYQNVKDYDDAVTEYFKLLMNQSSYINYILNRLRAILKEDETVIKKVEKTASKYDDPLVIEVIAMCFAEVGDYEKALENYDRLDAAKLIAFAQKMSVENKLDVSEQAYHLYIRKMTDPAYRASAKVKLAEVFLAEEKIAEAKSVLQEVRDDKDIKKSKYKYRTKASLESRLLLAEIGIRQDEPKQTILDYLTEGSNFAYNNNDVSLIEYQKIRYLMLIGDFEESKDKLSNLLKTVETGTEIYKLGYYYAFLLALMQFDPAADSLLGEIVINLPENEETNDALFLFILLSDLQNPEKETILTAYRMKLLYKNDQAIQQLVSLTDSTSYEELLVLAAEWAFSANDESTAIELLSNEFKDPVLAEYAELLVADHLNDEQMSRDFLRNNPQSVFSPEFRKILEKL